MSTSWRRVPSLPAENRGPPGWWQTLVGPAVLLVVAAVFTAAGRHRLPILLASIAVVTMLLGLLSPAFRTWAGIVERAIGGVAGRGITWVLLLIAYLLVVIPAGLVLRLLRVRPLQPGMHGRPASLWVTSSFPRPTASTRMFSEQRSWRLTHQPRTGGVLILRTVAAVLVVEALIIGGFVAYERRTTPVSELAGVGGYDTADTPALRDQPDVDQTLSDLGGATSGNVYAPFVGYMLRDFSSRFVNIKDRARKTYEMPLAADERPIDVWFFGGSTMFGFDAQRDLHTIPSEFVRLAEQAGIPVRARNYGTPGGVNYQETMLLTLLVSAGEHPDLVIFYDGINDLSLQVFNGLGEMNALGEPSDLGTAIRRTALFTSGAVPGTSDDPPAPLTAHFTRPITADDIVSATSQVMDQGMDVARALGARHDFDVLNFWQPTLYTKAELDPGETELLPRIGIDRFEFDVMSALSAASTRGLPKDVIDVTDSLDQVKGPVFADNVHINERGARAVAAAMFGHVRPELEARRPTR